MPGTRMSFAWAREDSAGFGKGRGSSYAWLSMPPGSYVSTSHARSTNRIDTVGTKKWDTVAYGKFSGSWDWSFILDYNYLEPLTLAFEGVSMDVSENEDNTFTYDFLKTELARVPSFCFRRKILNKIAGPTGDERVDETMELRGCVCKSIRFSMSAGSSQVNVTMSGFYTREVSDYSDISALDYSQKTDMNQVSFSCFLLGKMSNGRHITNVDSLGVTIDNGANTIDSTCTPFSPAYYEGKTNNAFTASVYANDGKRFHQLLYYGGDGIDIETGSRKETLKTPLCKGLAPLKEAHIFSFDECRTDSEASAMVTYNRSKNRADFKMTECVIKTISWARGDSGKLQDSLSSVECRDIQLTIRTETKIELGPSNTHKVLDQTDLSTS